MAYAIEILPEAQRTLSKLSKDIARRIAKAIDKLANEPRPSGAKALQGGEKGYTRIRVGEYRIIYSVDDGKLLVLIIRIGHRREVYR